ncbi:MAG: prolyl oligopeptidase family serine peptidase [Moraxella sp.]|nr:prolyl oligopeptidase family serine peptidase [Moraxella sp.]
MNITKKANLAMAVVSVMYLTAQPSFATDTQESTIIPQNTKHSYPATREHSVKKDIFRTGEFGRPSHLVSSDGAISSRTVTLQNERAMPDDGVDNHFGEKVYDKYRWLENIDQISHEHLYETEADRQRNFIGTRLENDRPNNQLDDRTTKSLQKVNPNPTKSEVTAWVDAQHSATMNHLRNIPILPVVEQNTASLYDYEHTIRRVKKPKIGELHFYRGTDGYKRVERIDEAGQVHELWRETDLERGLRDAKGDFYVSTEGSYFGIYLSTGEADADLTYFYVFDSMTGKEVTKRLAGQYITNPVYAAAWISDDTVLYSTSKDHRSEVYRHTVGSKRPIDPIEVATSHIDAPSFAAPWLLGKDNRYLVMVNSYGSMENAIIIKDLKTGKYYRPHDKRVTDKNRGGWSFYMASKFVHLDEETRDLWIVSGENDDQRGEIIKTNLDNLKKREVVVPVNPNYDRIIEAAYHPEGEGYFIINYKKDGQSRVVLTDMTGKVLKDLTPAPTGFADNLFGYVAGGGATNKAASTSDNIKADEGSYVSFRYENFGMPRTVYKYSIAKDEFIDIRRRDLYPFNDKEYTSELIKYRSKDGTEVPMTITYKKGTVLNGKNPTLMFGYGGFTADMETKFAPRYGTWLEHGGVFAMVHLRGGAEYGEAWHKDGMLKNKMNVFDDFESAADYLFAKGYTSPQYLAISGGSNGGLLVGAAMTLTPSKYRVAIPSVGVLDMFRHDYKYYAGRWDNEYGSAYDSKAMYDYLKSYSPYHNVKAGICYPSTLVTTSKRDDRVLPFHSYKFAAALQEHQSCDNPTYLFVDEVQGHGQRTPRQIKEYATYTVAFSFDEMGIKSVPVVERPTTDAVKSENWLKSD